MAHKFARFQSSSLQRGVGSIVRESVQITHHSAGRTETATENGVGQKAGLCRYCGSHSSVASLIAPDR